MVLQLLFWISLFAVAYTFVGYAIHIRVLNRIFRRKHEREEPESEGHPSISILLVVRNEEDRIEKRIANLAECSYDGDREIVVVADGCEDSTVEKVRSLDCDFSVHLIVKDEAEGKASGINAGASAASGDILVLADARQRFDLEALDRLVAPMKADGRIAAVSGSLEIEPSKEGAAVGIDAYWKLEKWIRNQEAQWDSVIGCTGAIYAIRKSYFRPIPADTLIDDVVIPMQALVDGGRILFSPEAIAYDPQTLDTRNENRRKVRTLAGNYQMLFRYPGWLLPWKNRCSWQLVSHKYLRLSGPVFLLLCFASSIALSFGSIFYLVISCLQALCYFCAAVGLVFPKLKHSAVTIPAGFVFLQWQSVRALGFYLSRLGSSQGGAWNSEAKESSS